MTPHALGSWEFIVTVTRAARRPYAASPWHCPSNEHVPLATNSQGNISTNGACNSSHTLWSRSERMLVTKTASHSQAIQIQIATTPAVGAAWFARTIQRKGPTPKPRAAIMPEIIRNGINRRRTISARRARRTWELNRRRTIRLPRRFVASKCDLGSLTTALRWYDLCSF